MTAAGTSRIQRALTHLVYVRTPPYTFRFAPTLNCNTVKLQRGAAPGLAEFVDIPVSGQIDPFEEVMAAFSVDQEVRVVVWPEGSNPLAEGPPGEDGFIIFEGLLQRHRFVARREGGGEDEDVMLVGVPWPLIDNRTSDFIIDGRWLIEPSSHPLEDGTLFICEAPSLPCVFNANGRPNRSSVEVTTQPKEEELVIQGWAFTHDDDAKGKWWTVHQALASLIVVWMYGPNGRWTQPRHVMLEPTTRTAFSNFAHGEAPETQINSDRWKGMDARLPEVDVQGMGVYDAIQAVCEAAGFDMAVEPVLDQANPEKRYQLRIWRKNSGTLKAFKISKRGQAPADAEAALTQNNVNMVRSMRDATGIVNEITAQGRQFIESRFVLKPFWNIDEVAPDALTPGMGLSGDQAPSTYHSRHVVGGSQFDQFVHVGRAWGIDCVGGRIDGYGAAWPRYHHDPDGFDFVSYLQLNDSNAILDQREQLNVTEPIRWSRRVRNALPLRSPEARQAGVKFILEVSEDFGQTFQRIDLKIETLDDEFGIRLVDERVANLAAVNAATLNSDATPPVEESWWALIIDRKLLFRLHCAVEADHAARYEAKRRSTSATYNKFGAFMPVDVEEVWRSSHGWYGNGSNFERVSGWSREPRTGDLISNVRSAADRRLDASEGLRQTTAAYTWLMQLQQWHLGDRVWGVRGREFSFATHAGGAERYPTIVALELTLAPEAEQGVMIQLDDEAMTRGGRR